MDPYESSLGPGGEDRHEGQPEDSRTGEPPSVAPEGGDSGEPIMGRLPKSRPKRETPRRKAASRTLGRKP